LKISGRVWKFGDNVNTDEIIAGKRLLSLNMQEIAKYAFEALDPGFSKKVKKGDILVAGKNFGCGSSREQAPIVIKTLGISAVIAESFARIFFRNAINIGLPVIECKGAYEMINEGDIIEVDLEQGELTDLTTGKKLPFKSLPKFLRDILVEGGILNYLEKYGTLTF